MSERQIVFRFVSSAADLDAERKATMRTVQRLALALVVVVTTAIVGSASTVFAQEGAAPAAAAPAQPAAAPAEPAAAPAAAAGAAAAPAAAPAAATPSISDLAAKVALVEAYI